MKKKYLCLFFLLFSGSLLFAQVDIGQQVLIVRANESENSEKLTAVIVDWLDENGFEKDAEAFRKYVSTGSGAVVEAPNGDLLVATSAHVMSQASTADVEVPAYGMNDQVLYQDLPVVYRSNKQDLCLLLLPEEARRTLAPMEISMEYSDGDDVLAAGYPSLMGEPSWQVRKGYISSTRANNLVFDVDLAGSVIQHSAPLSPGSSGGPLLVKEGEEYRIIGINSWLVARSLDSRIFFSVPAEDLLAVLDDYAGLSSLSFTDKEFMLQKKMNLMDDIFAEQDEELTDREKRAMVIPARDLFSVDYVLADGWTRFLNYLDSLEPDEFRFAVNSFFSGQGYKVLHRATMYEIAGRAGGKNGIVWSKPEFSDDCDSATVAVKIGSRKTTAQWEFTQGDWQLTSFPVKSAFQFSESSNGPYFGLSLAHRSFQLDIKDDTSLLSAAFFMGRQRRFFFREMKFSAALGAPFEIDNFGSLMIFDGSWSLGLRVPVLLADRKILLSPYASAGVGAGLAYWNTEYHYETLSDFAFSFPVSAGLELGFSKDGLSYPFRVAFDFTYPFYISTDENRLLQDSSGPVLGLSLRFSR